MVKTGEKSDFVNFFSDSPCFCFYANDAISKVIWKLTIIQKSRSLCLPSLFYPACIRSSQPFASFCLPERMKARIQI